MLLLVNIDISRITKLFIEQETICQHVTSVSIHPYFHVSIHPKQLIYIYS